MLTENINTERMDVNRAWYGDDFCTSEHQRDGTVPGEFLGIAGHGRRISFRLLHVWEFKDGRISRENVWLDGMQSSPS
jgi:predicted ester cyclase